MIPGLAFALFAVLDGFFGAVADAGHAVSAVFVPDRLSVFQTDVAKGAQLHALTAADAGVRCPEGLCFYKKPIENFDWHIFVTLLQEAKLDFGIRKYIPNLMANVTPIPTKAWSKVVFTEGYFKKKTRQMILNYWKQKKIDKMFGIQSKKHARKTQRKLNTKRK